ncbi:hypothetical protein QBD01_002412 [Ochrobactrum sp. 19YEA23]|uniref:hypothetical protein n=1 Tax=Ochrobactrum sp. 19YEA23 TaxID=3039854 RepID=UPI002479AB9C|nr:hypothetical protein [Ochrobactrum sp. 19YEA23]
MKLTATRRRPSGFRDPEYYSEEAEIVDFVFGQHRDARGYDRTGETVLAVFVNSYGELSYAPADQFTITEAGRAALRERE